MRIRTNIICKSIAAIVLLSSAIPVSANTYSWLGTGANDSWATASNWSPNQVPGSGDSVSFGPGFTIGSTTVDLSGAAPIGGLSFADSDDSFVLSNQFLTPPLAFDNGGRGAVLFVAGSYGGTATIDSSISLSDSLTVGNDGSGQLILGTLSTQVLSMGTNSLVISGPGQTTIAESINGSTNITKTGKGTLNLAGNMDTYTGDMNLNGGTINISNSLGHGRYLTVGNTTMAALNITDAGAHSWNDVIVGNGGNGSVAISNVNAGFTASALTIGNYNTGTFTQNGGTTTISAALNIANNAASQGSYNLSAGSLETNDENVGNAGAGVFTQSGGDHTVDGSLYVGVQPGSNGTFTLSDGSLVVNHSEYVGDSGTGSFIQTGGTHAIMGKSALSLGYNNGVTGGEGNGTYTLSDGTLTAGYEFMGLSGGTGTFIQTGGTNTVNASSGFLEPGQGGPGSYLLSGGSVTAPYLELGGVANSNGVFQQTGGDATFGAAFIGAFHAGAIGNYSLEGGKLSAGRLYISGQENTQGGTGTLTVSNTGLLIVTGLLQVYSGGQVNINGGSATIGSLSILPGGVVNINDVLTIAYGTGNPDPFSIIRSYLHSGYNGGAWDGSGIISTAAAGSSAATGLGYLDDGTQVIIQYTWMGDANLDGVVNAADLSDMARAGNSWATGDFNYDGKVDADDYALFMLGLTTSGGANISTALPEPTTTVFAFLAGAALIHRRRKAHG